MVHVQLVGNAVGWFTDDLMIRALTFMYFVLKIQSLPHRERCVTMTSLLRLCRGKRSFVWTRRRHLSAVCEHHTEFISFVADDRGTRWRSWLRHCATSRKVAGSIPDGVTGILH